MYRFHTGSSSCVVDVRRTVVVVDEAGDRVVDVELITVVGGSVVDGWIVVVVGRAGTAPASDGSELEHAVVDSSIAIPTTRAAFTPGLLRRFPQ